MTTRGIEQVLAVPDRGVPEVGHWYEVEVSNIDTGEKGKLIAKANTGAFFSCFPTAHKWLGIQGGGFTRTAVGSFGIVQETMVRWGCQSEIAPQSHPLWQG